MTSARAALLLALRQAQVNPDSEQAHALAATALVKFIDDEQIEAEYRKVLRWYS